MEKNITGHKKSNRIKTESERERCKQKREKMSYRKNKIRNKINIVNVYC